MLINKLIMLIIRNLWPWHSTERLLGHVLTSKLTRENGLGRLYVIDCKVHAI
jgi:hypothetical protein